MGYEPHESVTRDNPFDWGMTGDNAIDIRWDQFHIGITGSEAVGTILGQEATTIVAANSIGNKEMVTIDGDIIKVRTV